MAKRNIQPKQRWIPKGIRPGKAAISTLAPSSAEHLEGDAAEGKEKRDSGGI